MLYLSGPIKLAVFHLFYKYRRRRVALPKVIQQGQARLGFAPRHSDSRFGVLTIRLQSLDYTVSQPPEAYTWLPNCLPSWHL